MRLKCQIRKTRQRRLLYHSSRTPLSMRVPNDRIDGTHRPTKAPCSLLPLNQREMEKRNDAPAATMKPSRAIDRFVMTKSFRNVVFVAEMPQVIDVSPGTSSGFGTIGTGRKEVREIFNPLATDLFYDLLKLLFENINRVIASAFCKCRDTVHKRTAQERGFRSAAHRAGDVGSSVQLQTAMV